MDGSCTNTRVYSHIRTNKKKTLICNNHSNNVELHSIKNCLSSIVSFQLLQWLKSDASDASKKQFSLKE